MATFVLVHGAMHGGWCWRDVRTRLAAHGHDVHTPTLTGQGDRRADLRPDVGVATHVHDVAELMWFEDLREVCLVLHSYAGVLAGPLAERVGERVGSVVYLAAFVTAPGQSLLEVEPSETAARYRTLVAEEGEGWYLPATDAFLEQWGVRDEAPARLGRAAPDRLPLPVPDGADRVRPGAAGRAPQGLPRAYGPAAAQPAALLRRRRGRRMGDARAGLRPRRDASGAGRTGRPAGEHRNGCYNGGVSSAGDLAWLAAEAPHGGGPAWSWASAPR